MSTIRVGAATIAAAALFSLTFGGAIGTAADATKAAGKPVIFNLFGKGLVEPETIFLTANSGPYITDLEWNRWGKDGADGTGTYVSDCASCAPPEQREATIQLRKDRSCKNRRPRVPAVQPDHGRRLHGRAEDGEGLHRLGPLLQEEGLSGAPQAPSQALTSPPAPSIDRSPSSRMRSAAAASAA